MIYRKPREDEYTIFDQLANHPLQSKAWGDFRQDTGVKVRRLIGFDGADQIAQMQVTFHPIPKFPYTIGYYPKGRWPDEIQLQALLELGKEEKAIAIKMEPDVSMPPHNHADIAGLRSLLLENSCQKGRSLFTPHTFTIDLTQSEDQLLTNMKSKTRYNLKVAQKHGVEVVEDSTQAGFDDYLRLLELTTKRQGFYAHTKEYQQKMWTHMSQAGIARILKAIYQGQVVTAWILFVFKDKLYYPYGASSREHTKVMASNIVMWEAIRYGQKLGLKTFDLWGSLGPNPDPKDPWYGFHRFKQGYGGTLTEFVGTYDLVVNPQVYSLYRIADRWRWRLLRLKSKLSFIH